MIDQLVGYICCAIVVVSVATLAWDNNVKNTRRDETEAALRRLRGE